MTTTAIPQAAPNSLSAARQKLLDALQDGIYESITDLCQKAGIDRKSYYNAIDDPEFVELLFKQSSAVIYKSIPRIMNKVVKQAENGSFAHQKMLMEMLKLYQGTPQVAIQQNTTHNYNFSREELLEEAYRLVAEDKGVSVESLK